MSKPTREELIEAYDKCHHDQPSATNTLRHHIEHLEAEIERLKADKESAVKEAWYASREKLWVYEPNNEQLVNLEDGIQMVTKREATFEDWKEQRSKEK